MCVYIYQCKNTHIHTATQNTQHPHVNIDNFRVLQPPGISKCSETTEQTKITINQIISRDAARRRN